MMAASVSARGWFYIPEKYLYICNYHSVMLSMPGAMAFQFSNVLSNVCVKIQSAQSVHFLNI